MHRTSCLLVALILVAGCGSTSSPDISTAGAPERSPAASAHPPQTEARPPLGQICCGVGAGEEHTLACGKDEVIYTNTHANGMCVEIWLADECPTRDSEFRISGHAGSAKVPDDSADNYRMKVPGGQTVTFRCRGDGEPGCRWAFMRDFEEGANSRCNW